MRVPMTSMRKCLDELDDNERRRVKRIIIEFEPEDDQELDTDSEDLEEDEEEEEEEDSD